MSLKRKEPMDEAASSNSASPKRQRDMEEILKSRHITFVVGPEKEEFTVHEASIASLSEPLRVLITGNMKEAAQARVVWDDAEPTVFASLMEYAYSGNLSIPACHQNEGLETPDEPEKKTEEDQSEGEDDARDESERAVVEEKNNHSDDDDDDKTPSLLKDILNDKGTGRRHCAKNKFAKKHFLYKKSCPSCTRLDTDGIPCDIATYTAIAKLYVLADKYDVAALKNLCTSRLTRSLSQARGIDKTLSSVVQTIRFLYERTLKKDQLRQLLLRFLIADLEWAMRNSKVRTMLSDTPELASELFLLVPHYYWKELQKGHT
ncbi:hypothetical protein CGLO_14436 [Colletotrichum gloeosporioides Cg-14]|uniref:BTB domain-containing protein n=1 Tax=Colletotrichum gloeosporioides (strain Cg-14) TaxID=1237896 RepID=T0K413_COLGC|nr:hypothetical protein CGLO_14436 [Colletotrichum gloeosporioides Cg-14]